MQSRRGQRHREDLTSDALVPPETILARSEDTTYVLRLYIAGYTRRSVRALENIRHICDHFLRDRYELTIISLVDHAEEAKKEQVIAAPTLVKAHPLPVRRLIGDLSDEGRLLLALDIHTTDES